MEATMQGTQYGFRKKRSTENAIFLVRRLIDLGERSQNKVNMIREEGGASDAAVTIILSNGACCSKQYLSLINI